MADSLTTASVLAFERKLDPSDALFFSGQWNDKEKNDAWKPISLQEKAVRCTISNRLGKTEHDPIKVNQKIEKPNLQTVDVATLPPEADTLKATFTLRVLEGAGIPSACNNAAYQAKLLNTVQGYTAANGFGELARRYAHNLANGRFLWRNRMGAEQVEIRVGHMVGGGMKKVWTFDALAFSIRDFAAPDGTSGQAVAELAALMADGLSGKSHVLLSVTAFVRLGVGQEVFPSQELILDRERGKKSKTLYQVAGIAGMHSQKIGNAIRTIDDWYPGAETPMPIAVEAYGSVTTLGKAYRQPKDKEDFYNLLDNWLLKDKVPSLENQHYVMAMLIRGGVFGE